jgi:hypothetical protein
MQGAGQEQEVHRRLHLREERQDGVRPGDDPQDVLAPEQPEAHPDVRQEAGERGGLSRLGRRLARARVTSPDDAQRYRGEHVARGIRRHGHGRAAERDEPGRQAGAAHLGGRLAGAEPGVGHRHLGRWDQAGQVRLEGDVEEQGEHARAESHEHQVPVPEAAEQHGDGNGGEQHGPADIRDQDDAVPRIAVRHRPGEWAEQDRRKPFGRRDQAQLEW